MLKRTDLSEPNFEEVIDPIFDPIGLNVPGPGDHVRVLEKAVCGKKMLRKYLSLLFGVYLSLFEFII